MLKIMSFNDIHSYDKFETIELRNKVFPGIFKTKNIPEIYKSFFLKQYSGK